MEFKHYYIQVQDTTPSNQIKIDISPKSIINTELNIERNTIKIATIRKFSVDSTRLKPKKTIRPIIKTIAQIPKADTIQHPTYNIVDNNFLFPEDLSFFDGLYFTPYNPSLKTTNKSSSNKVLSTIDKKTEKTITKTIQSEKSFISTDKLDISTGFGSTDWMLGIIVFSLILFSWIRVGYNRFYQTAIQASYNFFTARRINEEVNVTRNWVFHIMNFLFYINIALFLSQFLEYYHFTIYKLQGILLFLTIFIAILVLYNVKSILFHLLDFLFLGKKAFFTYISTIFLYNKMIGIILLPIIALIPYVPKHITPWLFYAGTIIIIILYIFRIFRGLQICFKNRLSIFYLILYLCALEILPTLILFKVISSYL